MKKHKDIMEKNDAGGLYLGCPVQHALQFLAGKWQIGILWNIRKGPLRFSEIKKQLPGISDKMLMKELDFFVQKSIIERLAHKFPSPRIEYRLTPSGRRLIPVIDSIVEWGYFHLQDEKAGRHMSMTPLPVIDTIERDMAE